MVMMMIQVIVVIADRGTSCDDADNFNGDGDYRGHSPRTSAMGQSRMKRSTFAMSGIRPEADAAGLALRGFDPRRFG